MPKKIRRSNNPLRKTNRKGRKTANRNRLRKFVGGVSMETGKRMVWKADGNVGAEFSLREIVKTKHDLDFLKNEDGLFYKLIDPIFQAELNQLADYITNEHFEFAKEELERETGEQRRRDEGERVDLNVALGPIGGPFRRG